MSWRASHHVWEHTQVTRLARYVLLAIADRANKQGRAWPSLADLVRRTGLCRRTVIKCIAEAKRRGELLVEHTGRHNFYEIPAGDRCTSCTSPSDTRGARDALRGAPDAPRGASRAPGTYHEPTKNHDAPAARRRSAHAQRRARASLRSRSTGGRSILSDRTAPPDPRVRVLIAAFSESHRDALAQPYL